jgi:hypothetical protein
VIVVREMKRCSGWVTLLTATSFRVLFVVSFQGDA